jgi:hypothetical protein
MNTYARPAEGAKKPDQKPDQEPLTLALSQRERGLTGAFGRGTPTCDTALNSGFEKHTNQPLSLHSRRDRGLTGVFGRGTPTCDTALNSGFEKHTNQPLSLHSRRDRGLAEVFGGAMPTCDNALNSSSKKQKNRPPHHEEKETDRGVWESYADVQYRVELRF